MATDAQVRFHREWLGLAQPYEGLVFSVPALADAQITPEATADLTARYRRALVMPSGAEVGHIGDLKAFFENFLGYTQTGALLLRDALPKELHFYAQEGQQELRPSFALARTLPIQSDDLFGNFGKDEAGPEQSGNSEDASPPESKAARAQDSPYIALVWDVRDDAGADALGLDLDKPEAVTGPWRYPPTAKFERLLRAVGVPVGLLCNGHDVRLVYAPPGESTSHLTFRGEFMQRPDGRPILAAFELLLNAQRTYQAAAEFTFEGLLKESRSRQADVTKELASQVFEAVELLLAGFEAASRRDGANSRMETLRAALEEPHDHAYQGVLSVVLRLVFLLYSEDQGLLPVQNETYSSHLSVKGLYDELVEDAGQHPESMNHRFGAYGRLLSLFRAIFFGVEHGELRLPPRRGRLFDPNSFPFLEGGLPGTTAARLVPEERAQTLPPSVDDGTVYEVLHRLIFFQGQRLSYASLDVEQLGSVYESLMGFHILRTVEPAVRVGKNRLWVGLGELRRAKGPKRKTLLKEEAGLSGAQVTRVEALLKEHKDDVALADALNELSPGGKKERHKHRAGVGRLLLQPGEERRRSGSHYTPRSLTEGIVRKTLEPLLKCFGDEPTEEQILALKLCDPAMGSGAFLVEVVRQLAAKLVDVWTREKRLAALSDQYADPHLHARRLVAQRCVYGVDKNAAAVELAKLSLWLVTLSAERPFTFVDHALRHGDSLVGLSLDQVSSFHWAPQQQLPLLQQVLKDGLDQALEHRAELVGLAHDDTPRTQDERRRLLDHAEQATDRIRVIADVCVGAFFAAEKDKARNAERKRRMDLVEFWLKGDASVEPELRALADETRERLAPFHWMIEFPEVFYLERPDPLDGWKVNGAAMMDGFVGNPPFMGVAFITEKLGTGYVPWLQELHLGTTGKFDLCAHFFRRSGMLLGSHGVVALVATNTIGQGDTRETGLQCLLKAGFTITSATTDLRWPGDAAVTVCVVHLAKGRAAKFDQYELDGNAVASINSRLRPKSERADATSLSANTGAAYVGTLVLGMGFMLTPEECEQLVAKNANNAERILPYLGGEEVNTSATQDYHRQLISFGQLDLEQAARWPDLLEIVRERVKPERERIRDSISAKAYKKFWWRFARYSIDCYAAVHSLSRCLVTARTSKHITFSFQPSNRIFSENLIVFPLQAATSFVVLQSRVHWAWVRLTSSTLEDRQGYRPSDCFETFPFPQADPRTVIRELEVLGERLHQARAKYMVDTDQGLTKTYNALKDPSCTDQRIVELRRIHEDMDRAVLRAYPKLPGVGSAGSDVVGWSDVTVPSFCIATDAEKAELQAFEDDVIERLFVLNESRAKEEREQLKKLGTKGKSQQSKKSSKSKTSKGEPPDTDQGDLF